ncbi:hypothetical protein IH981_03825, partial [Patescibacteria group bacterium]|nr:hypothetical protein [Patescibacteria group bacterium]
VEALETLFKRKDVELLVSEESLAEIRKLNQTSQKRKDLEAMYFKLKQRKSVIRNSAVLWSDPIATWNSPDVYYDHPYKDTDLNKVKQFLASKGNTNDFDTRYIANAMLSENKIDVFLTFDKSSLWRHRNEIKRLFGVEVKLPSEI